MHYICSGLKLSSGWICDGLVYLIVLYAVLYSSRQMNATTTYSTSCVLLLMLQNLLTFILVCGNVCSNALQHSCKIYSIFRLSVWSKAQK